jgi:hypothetical protein
MVPGMTLPAGRYVFQLAHPTAARSVVEIRSEDAGRVITTAMVIPTSRTEPKGDVTVTLQRTDPTLPPALKGWFYPGALRGHEFMYPEKQARVLADETKTLVLTSDASDGSSLDAMSTATLWHAGPKGERRDYKESPKKESPKQ